MDVHGFRPVDYLASQNFHRHIRLIDGVVMGAELLQEVALATDYID